LGDSATNEILERILSISVDGALATALQESKEELRKIIADKSRHPMTYNHYFIANVQKSRQRKHQHKRDKAFEAASRTIAYQDGTTSKVCDPVKVKEILSEDTFEHDMDKFSSEEALDYQCAYYKVNLPSDDLILSFANTSHAG
jgi:hypothetical protein